MKQNPKPREASVHIPREFVEQEVACSPIPPMKHKTLAVSIKDPIELDNDNVDEYKDGRPTRMGDVSSQQSSKSRVLE